MRRAASTSAITDVSMMKEREKEYKYWCMVDSKEFVKNEDKKLPLESLNHLAREVLCVETSKKFYCDILGFQVRLFLRNFKSLMYKGNCSSLTERPRRVASWLWNWVLLLYT